MFGSKAGESTVCQQRSSEAYVCLKKENGNKKERILFGRIAEWPVLNTSATAKAK